MNRILGARERNEYLDSLEDKVISIRDQIINLITRNKARIGTTGNKEYFNCEFNYQVGRYIGLLRQYMDCLTDDEKDKFMIGRRTATNFLQELLCSTNPPALEKRADPTNRRYAYYYTNEPCFDLLNGISEGYSTGVKQLPDSARKKIMKAIVSGRDAIEDGGAGKHIVKSIRDGRLSSFRGLEKIEVYTDGVTGYGMEDLWLETRRKMKDGLRGRLDR